MKINSKIFSIQFLIFFFFLFATIPPVQAGNLYEERIYEPVVLMGSQLAAFNNVPLNEIFLYAYSQNSQTWKLIPFQIDERIHALDPFKNPADSIFRHSYFLPDDGLLDNDDEFVFMIRDLGDRANAGNWIDNPESKSFLRLEIEVKDPIDSEKKAYGYLYRSTSIQEPVPTPYSFEYDAPSHTVSNPYYSVRMSTNNGLIEDIALLPPFGTGVDIFDTQKIRINGVFDFGTYPFYMGRGGVPSANERDNIYLYNEIDTDQYYHQFNNRPVVRLIREVRQTLGFGSLHIDDLAFYVKTKFYPFSGTLEGGANLDPEKLKEELGTVEDVYIQLDLLRQSWDFNAQASDMKFHNRYNENVSIDGVQDEVNKKIDVPIYEWSLASGDQGSMFTFITFADTSWGSIELYYYDNKDGGQNDNTYVISGDTGDKKSYGDHGILFKDLAQQSVNLQLNFIAYFLPANLAKSDGEQLAYWLKNPPVITTKATAYTSGVEDADKLTTVVSFALEQNYPNPFNSVTQIRFSLPQTALIKLTVFDISGREIKALIDQSFPKGEHSLSWDGTNSQNQKVSSGVYIYKLESEYFSDSKKMILLY